MARETAIVRPSSLRRDLVAVTRREAVSPAHWLPFSYDPTFAERVVMLLVANPGSDRCVSRQRYYELTEQLYQLPPDNRPDAFARLHRQLFIELGYEQLLREGLAEFPAIADAIVEVVVTRTSRERPEGADLRKRLDNGRWSMSLALRPQRLLAAEELRRLLRHELQHTADMLDPGFGYVRATRLSESPARQNDALSLYRMLWDISVDGRLTRAGKTTIATKCERLEAFARVLAQLPPGAAWAVFDGLWETNFPTHTELMMLATEVKDAIDENSDASRGFCALCQFPTCVWTTALSTEMTALIEKDFPKWSRGQRICAHCAEFYEMKAGRI